MPGLPLLFTDSGAPADTIYHPLPGLYLGDDTFLSDGIWLDEGISEAFAPTPGLAVSGIVTTVTPVPAEAFMPVPTLPTIGDVIEIVTPVPATAFMPIPDFVGEELVETVAPVPATAFMPVPSTSGSISVVIIPSVRELPPLRISHLIETPSGRFFRWGADESNPANVPSGERFSDTMPGGFETSDATLPRKVGESTPDLEPFSTWNIYGAGGELVWEGRIERSPRSSGDQVSVTPAGVGLQAALDDDKSARAVYVDRDLSRWGPMANQRRLSLIEPPNWEVGDGSVGPGLPAGGGSKIPSVPTDLSGLPALSQSIHGPWTLHPIRENWYDAGPDAFVGKVYYAWQRSMNIGLPDPNWSWSVLAAANSVADAGVVTSGNIASTVAGNQNRGSGTLGVVGGKRYVGVQFYYGLNGAGGDVEYTIAWTCLAVYGDHGLPTYGTADLINAPGVLASDVVTHAVSRYAPSLSIAGVSPSAFVISHLVFPEATTAGEIVKSATRFGLQDWAVWDNKTFWFHDRGARGRSWRARIGPAQLEETGPQADRVWESVIVQYQDVDGSTKTAGPLGARTDIEDAALKDEDPENPANRAGIQRRALLTTGVSTPAGAVEIGRRFLEEQKLLDRSGRVRIIGHVESDRGVTFPYHAIRAGDTLSVIDAADSSPRRIVRTEKDHSSRTCNIDLDAPPAGLEQLLERLGVSLVPLGLS